MNQKIWILSLGLSTLAFAKTEKFNCSPKDLQSDKDAKELFRVDVTSEGVEDAKRIANIWVGPKAAKGEKQEPLKKVGDLKPLTSESKIAELYLGANSQRPVEFFRVGRVGNLSVTETDGIKTYFCKSKE